MAYTWELLENARTSRTTRTTTTFDVHLGTPGTCHDEHDSRDNQVLTTCKFQLVGSASVSMWLLSSGAAGLWLLVVCASVFNDVCAGGRRPARRTATLSVRRLVWARTSSGKSGHMARSSRRRRLACFARSLASCCGEVRGVARGNGVFFIFLFLSFFSVFLLGCAF